MEDSKTQVALRLENSLLAAVDSRGREGSTRVERIRVLLYGGVACSKGECAAGQELHALREEVAQLSRLNSAAFYEPPPDWDERNAPAVAVSSAKVDQPYDHGDPADESQAGVTVNLPGGSAVVGKSWADD